MSSTNNDAEKVEKSQSELKDEFWELSKQFFIKPKIIDSHPQSEEEQKNTFVIDPSDLRKIETIVNKNNKYFSNKDSFIRESIDVMCKFWEGPFPELTKKMEEMWRYLPADTKKYVEETSPEYYYQMEIAPTLNRDPVSFFNDFIKERHSTNEIIRTGKINFKIFELDSLTTDEHLIKSKPNQLILDDDYVRIFPVKLVLEILKQEIISSYNQKKSTWINYEMFRGSVYDTIKMISVFLKNKEEEIFSKQPKNVIIKTKKISVGLPHITLDSMKKNPIREKSSQNIFLETYVGSTLRTWKKTRSHLNQKVKGKRIDELDTGYMFGMLQDLGLAKFQKSDDNTKNKPSIDITITQLGLEFLLLTNPILDENTYEKSLSNEEAIFFKDKLLSNFLLEKLIISHILNILDSFGKNDSPVGKIDLFKDCLHDHEIQDIIMDRIHNFSMGKCRTKEENDYLRPKLDLINKKILNEKSRGQNIMEKNDKIPIPEELQNFLKWLNMYRISLMGRISEAGLVRWEIEYNISKYYPSNLK